MTDARDGAAEGGSDPVRIRVGSGEAARDVAAIVREGQGAPVVWMTGFRSEMRSVKATALDAWAQARGRPLVRFDYTGHGASGGAFEAGGVSVWLEDTLAILERFVRERPILVGSSMGGWLALLATRAPKGLVLLAPAVDFTERLMWDRFPDHIRRAVEVEGVFHRPSAYGDGPYPITRHLIEDGRRHLLFGRTIRTGCPVHIVQGLQDPDVPYAHALELVEHLPGEDVSLTLIKDGDHRLSRPEDLAQLIRAIEAMPWMGHSRPASAAPRRRGGALVRMLGKPCGGGRRSGEP